MPKKKSKSEKGQQPKFLPGGQLYGYTGSACLIIDDRGRPWWVDPETRTLKRAVVSA